MRRSSLAAKIIRLILLMVAAATIPAGAQNPVPPPDSIALRTITARGRMLAEYDQVAWHGTDAILAKMPSPTGVEGFLAMRDGAAKWRLLFGRLVPNTDSLLIVARAEQAEQPASFAVTISPTPNLGTNLEVRAFRALKVAGAELQASGPPYAGAYNSYVLPTPDGTWLVYFLPGQTQAGVFPHGGDFRYEVTGDGRKITSKLQMHRTVLMSRVPPEAVAGMHTVLTADMPHESDVFLVLSRSPRKPEVIGTAHFDYEVHEDGAISWRYGVRTKSP